MKAIAGFFVLALAVVGCSGRPEQPLPRPARDLLTLPEDQQKAFREVYGIPEGEGATGDSATPVAPAAR